MCCVCPAVLQCVVLVLLCCSGEETELRARGRHDPCVVPRAVPMVESMVAMVLADQLMQVGGNSNNLLRCTYIMYRKCIFYDSHDGALLRKYHWSVK